MQPADNALLGRKRMVVLHEIGRDPRVARGAATEHLGKEPPVVAELLRDQDLNGGDLGLDHLHRQNNIGYVRENAKLPWRARFSGPVPRYRTCTPAPRISSPPQETAPAPSRSAPAAAGEWRRP